MKTDRSIKKITKSQLDDIVNIHIEALPDDVLPSLGRYVLSNYYKIALADSAQELFGLVSNNNVLGFCLISTVHAEISSLILSAQGFFALIKLILRRPKILYSGLMQFLKKREIGENTAEISFIAVLPKYQGEEIGSLMLNYANQWCRERQIAFLQTKTSNQSLRNFYVRMYRAEEIGSFDLLGRRYSELKWATSLTGGISTDE